MRRFQFKADNELIAFLDEVAEEMIQLLKITEEEAVGRINKAWEWLEPIGSDLIQHEEPSYWAKTIYYGRGVHWLLGEDELEPIPYP